MHATSVDADAKLVGNLQWRRTSILAGASRSAVHRGNAITLMPIKPFRRSGAMIQAALSWILTAAATVMSLAVIHREFFGSRPTGPEMPMSRYEPAWRSIRSPHIHGDPAKIQIVEFMDLQCPFCKKMNEVSRKVEARYGDSVAFVFIHFPLASHKFGLDAARVAECAGELGRFEASVDALYAQQDSFGLKSWTSYARSAGVADTEKFQRCFARTQGFAAIDSGLTTGKRLHVQATPTVILNGWRYARPPSDTELVRAIGDLLAGKKPYSGFKGTQ